MRGLGERLGGLVAERFREEGVDLRLGVGVESFEGEGRVEGVRLANGQTLPCDVVLVGIGVRPSTGWLADSGLDVSNGVLCDRERRDRRRPRAGSRSRARRSSRESGSRSAPRRRRLAGGGTPDRRRDRATSRRRPEARSPRCPRAPFAARVRGTARHPRCRRRGPTGARASRSRGTPMRARARRSAPAILGVRIHPTIHRELHDPRPGPPTPARSGSQRAQTHQRRAARTNKSRALNRPRTQYSAKGTTTVSSDGRREREPTVNPRAPGGVRLYVPHERAGHLATRSPVWTTAPPAGAHRSAR